MNVVTNIAKKFLQLISKHFPKGHKLNKVFNRNNVKVSYSCMPNIASIINTHNKKVINRSDEVITTPGCNCRRREECPLRGKCLEKSVVYCGKVMANNEDNGTSYIGVTENTWKDRNYKHRNSYKDQVNRMIRDYPSTSGV